VRARTSRLFPNVAPACPAVATVDGAPGTAATNGHSRDDDRYRDGMGMWARGDVRQAFADQLAGLARATDAGAEAIGWKIGVATPASMTAAGIDAPLVGHLLASGRVEPGATIDVADWADPRLEPELAVYLGADVPSRATPEEASAAITEISLAFELVDVTGSLTDAPAMLRGNVFQRGVVLGERAPVQPPPAVTVLIDGEVHSEIADPVAATGTYASLVQHLAAVLGAQGRALRAGQVIITGMLTPPIQLAPGTRCAMRAPGLAAIELAIAGAR